MFAQSLQEEQKLDAMQRVWQRRGTSTPGLFDEVNETEELLTLSPLSRQNSRQNIQRGACVPPPQTSTCEEEPEPVELLDHNEPAVSTPKVQFKRLSSIELDASTVGDLPARYKICAVGPHQMPVVGVYVDPRIIPGFKYRVRPLPSAGKNPTINKCLFNDRALILNSIGRGYCRRFTFEADQNKLNDNDNYFWSDNRPEGYAFELEAVSMGDKFTIYDVNREPQGTLEVLQIEGPQFEISSSSNKACIEKRAKVKFIGKVEFYETGVAKMMEVSGVAVVVKAKGKRCAEVTKVVGAMVAGQRYLLLPGIQNIHRRFTVRGDEIGDVPTKYTMSGLEMYEIPVVGTYVDPRIIPGFTYKVRPNNRKRHLFGGRALPLLSIGMGYAKRLTFQPDSLVSPENYLWSDNHPDGLGLEPIALQKGMRFDIKAADQTVGEATVFRADRPQFEERMEKVKTAKGIAIRKYIHIDVMCHIRLARTGGASTENEEYLMRVSGLAVVQKEPRAQLAKVIRVENIGLDSQLTTLFSQSHTELTFTPVEH